MPVLHCHGNCYRSISISDIPGGNPVALKDPENWVVDYVHCLKCENFYCLDCAEKPQHVCPPQFFQVNRTEQINKNLSAEEKELKRLEFFSSDISIPQAVSSWKAKEVNGEQLMRKLVEYQNWETLTDVEYFLSTLEKDNNPQSRVAFYREADGTTRLLLFSEKDSYRIFQERIGKTEGDMILETSGSYLFQLDLNGVDFIEINPFSENSIQYLPHHFQGLREFAKTVEIEEKLRALRSRDHFQERFIPEVRNYQGFILPVVIQNGTEYPLRAPDDQGRNLISIFTAEDIFRDYQLFHFEKYCHEDISLLPLGTKINGERLFDWISKIPNCDGFVVNCNHNPVAFQSRMAQVFLTF
jgi:hypothetical protein